MAKQAPRFRRLGTLTVNAGEGELVYGTGWTDGDAVVELVYLRTRRVLAVHVEAAPASYRSAPEAELGLLWARQTSSQEPDTDGRRSLLAELQFTAEHLDELAGISVSPAFIRDLRIGQLLNEALEDEAASRLATANSKGSALMFVSTETATAVGFETVKQATAHIRMASAAALYVMITESGVSKPVVAVARNLDCSESAARALLARARREGYLTPGNRGKPGGQLTDKSKQLLEALSGNAIT